MYGTDVSASKVHELAIKSQKFVAKYYKWLEFIISCTMIFLNRPKMQYAQA